MAMKNAKNAHYLQIDNRVKQILEKKGVVVLASPEAWKKFKWARKWFEKKPKEGYFIWLKKEVDFPLLTCITIASSKISQNLKNLLVIEKNIRAKADVICNAKRNNLSATHKAKGKLILKEGSSLEYTHFHRWGDKDNVLPDYEFILKKESQLIYTYKNLFPPKILKLKTTISAFQKSKSNLNFIIAGLNSEVDLKDTLSLEEKDAQGIVKFRLVGKKNSDIRAKSTIIAKAPGKGHLDCQGLLLDEDSKISLIPELICQNKKAQITHEASIGKIEQEQLNYLRQRGLTEKEAIDLIVSGFLKVKEDKSSLTPSL
jgi:Fe-S cluster assembly scaffold protein SufB